MISKTFAFYLVELPSRASKDVCLRYEREIKPNRQIDKQITSYQFRLWQQIKLSTIFSADFPFLACKFPSNVKTFSVCCEMCDHRAKKKFLLTLFTFWLPKQRTIDDDKRVEKFPKRATMRRGMKQLLWQITKKENIEAKDDDDKRRKFLHLQLFF